MSELSRWLGDVFKAAIEKTGLSQQEVGHAAGVDNRTILNIENYRGNPWFSHLYPLVRFYKLDPRILLYPEIQQDSPAISQLRALVNDCTEEEAATLLSVCETIISAFRSKDGTVLKQKKSLPPLR